MFTAIFIDGPLASEVMVMQEANPEWKVPILPRTTVCFCDEGMEIPSEAPYEVFCYHLVARGEKVLLYSKHESDEKAIVGALLSWVQTDLSATDRIVACRDKRAYQ
jgi:hypothetical protein